MPQRLTTFLELIVAKLTALLVSLLISGATWAADEGAAAAEVVLPEPNYVGIIIFLVLMFGSGLWFVLKLMKGSKNDAEK